MKAYLEFNLPEDQEEFEIASKAGNYYSALFEIQNNLRRKVEHYQENCPQADIIDYIFSEIAEQTEGLDL